MYETHTNKATHTEEQKQAVYGVPKPFVTRVVMPDGKVRLIGVTEAARWMGVKQPALSTLAHGRNAFPISWEHRAREEFPGLFENPTVEAAGGPAAAGGGYNAG